MSYLDQYVIYDHPSDYPDYFVVRGFRIGDGQVTAGNARLYDTLEAARASLPHGLMRLLPAEEDDDVILETWV